MAKNTKYSHKDLTNQNFKHLPASDFNNSIIVNSCLYQEITHGKELPPDGVDTFPPDVVGLVLDGCNLDNVNINHPGITVVDARGIPSSTRKIMADNEGRDCHAKDNGGTWEADKANKVSSAILISNITQANPGVVSVRGSGLSNGDTIKIKYVRGMKEANGDGYKVGNVALSTFELNDLRDDPVDTSGFGAYVSGGEVFKI